MANNQANLDLYIEELVLHGVDPGDRYLIADAIEMELERLLMSTDLTAGLNDELAREIVRESVEAPPIRLRASAPARAIGSEVAGALHGVLSQTLTGGDEGGEK